MAQSSRPYTNNSTGDGTSYTAAQWRSIYRDTFTSGVMTGLATTGAASPLSVSAGSAWIDGVYYQSTAAEALTVATPAATTAGHVILRVDFATGVQTARLVAVRATSGSLVLPTLTTTSDTLFEMRLATFTITAAGAITLTDARTWLHPNARLDRSSIDGGTNTRIPYFDSTGRLTDSALMGFDGSTLHNTATNGAVELGARNTSNTPLVDFHSSGNDIDYDARIVASGGNASIGNATLNMLAGALQWGGLELLRVFRRQGGHATDWSVAGGTNLTPAGVYLQVGSAPVTVAGFTNNGQTTITFPQAFSATPVVIACGASFLHAGVDNVTATGARLWLSNYLANGTTYNNQPVTWLAIGPR